MLSSRLILLALSAIGVTAVAVGAKPEQPACVSKCWANSQYVSNCAGDQQCLCDDSEFQNALYQCLYSQCQTAQFGLALHHALDLCKADSINYSHGAGLRQNGEDLRRRGYQSQSASVVYSRTSSRASGTQSTPVHPGHASQTQSVHNSYTTSRAGGTTPVTPVGPKTTGPATFTSAHASQSVSAYQSYSTSRANPMGYSSVLTLATHTVAVRASHTGVRSSTAAAQYTHEPVAESSSVAPAAPAPSTNVQTPRDVRVQWNDQRYPADIQA